MTSTLDLHFAEIDARCQDTGGVHGAYPSSLVTIDCEPRRRTFIGPYNEQNLLRGYTFIFEFGHMQATFLKTPLSDRGDVTWEVLEKPVGERVRVLSLSPEVVLSDGQLSQLLQLIEAARTEPFDKHRIMNERLGPDSDNVNVFGRFLQARVIVQCHRTNQMRLLLDRDWDNEHDDTIVNVAGHTSFSRDVTKEFQASLRYIDDEEGEENEVALSACVSLHLSVLTDLEAAAQHISYWKNRELGDAPRTPEVEEQWSDERWYPLEKPYAAVTLRSEDREMSGMKLFARLIDASFDEVYTYYNP